MLAQARRELPPDGALPGTLQFEHKPDGFRAVVFARTDLVRVQSRQGTDLNPAFPDIAQAAAQLGEDLVLDGELVVAHEGRLDFGELQRRARRSGRSAVQATAEHPAYLIVFDVLEAAGTELVARPYRERRALLEDLFACGVLTAPFTLCPATGDRATALDWLDPAWGAAGIEGVVVKGTEQTYQMGKRGWLKVRSRSTSEGVIGAVTGATTSPDTLLLARYDAAGKLRLIARTTPLAPAVRRDLGERLRPAGPGHPWHGRRFSAGWGARSELDFHPVQPDVIAEFIADTSVDAGCYRHPVRFLRIRAELHPMHVPLFGEEDDSAGRTGSQYEG
ncbi:MULTISPECIES: ATP-dependent DNA ligase [unclassified Streptomyces]|uniref:ATP-dependent DNA ligase n=1 Tax=Streptomyces sp. NBC_00060 TaxID=2975636 RepID=A0AAU2HA77_9ACTN